MSVLATDNFNRANNDDLGASWDVETSDSAFKVAGNTAQPSSTSADCAERNNAATWPNDQYSQAALTDAGTGVGGGAGIGVAVRMSTSQRTYYRFVIDHKSTNNAEIAKIVNNSYTQLVLFTNAFTNGDTFKIEVVGTTINIYRNGSSIRSTTDSSIASGRAGIVYSSTASGDTSIDDWEGGDVSAAQDKPELRLKNRNQMQQLLAV